MRMGPPIGNQNNVRIFLNVNGEEYTIEQASKKFGVSYSTIRKRLIKGLKGNQVITPVECKLRRGVLKVGIRAYKLVMHDFYTKSHRLECYKQLIKDMKELRMKIAA